MKIDAVFSGGGMKAHAFIGVLESLDKRNYMIERVAGTSAGAIIAALIAAKYQGKEIYDLINNLNLKKLLDPPKITEILPFSKWFFLYFKMGLYRGDQFEKWLYRQLAFKNIYTFKDIDMSYLKVIVSDLSLGKLVVIPDDLKRLYNIEPDDFLISKAVRMSAGFPYFFMPKKLIGRSTGSSFMVDGGLLSNFPLWVFEGKHSIRKRPILGVKLSSSVEDSKPKDIKNAYDMFHALFTTMKQAHDARYISRKDENNIIFIPVEKVDTMDFKIEQETKDNLVAIGREHTESFLHHWPR